MAERTMSQVPGPDGKLIPAEDLEFEVVAETKGKYKLDDGTILELRLVPQKISRGLTKDGSILYKAEDGEPYYMVKFNALVTPRIQKDMLRGVQ